MPIAPVKFPFDEDEARDLSERVYDRCYAPVGRVRQMTAIQRHPTASTGCARSQCPRS